MLNKILWFIRYQMFRFFFQSSGFLGYLGKPIIIHRPSRIAIGNRVRIFPGLRMECRGSGTIKIHDNVAIQQNVHITSAGDLQIGKGTLVLGNVFITNIHHSYEKIGIPPLDQRLEVRETAIGENCFIGFGAAIQAGTVLGDGCIVGANSVVSGVFPQNTIIVGIPGRVIKKYREETGSWESHIKEW